jgi:hypothetical protein
MSFQSVRKLFGPFFFVRPGERLELQRYVSFLPLFSDNNRREAVSPFVSIVSNEKP